MTTRVEMLSGFPKGLNVCEAGVRKGHYSKFLISEWLCPKHVYLIDKQHNKNVDKLIKGYSNVDYKIGLFDDIVKNIPAIDLVYIDGLHDFVSVKNDLSLFDKITKRWICGHDYIPEGEYNFQTYHDFRVREAVEEFISAKNYYLTFITDDLSNLEHDPDAKGGKNKLYSYVISKNKADHDLFLKNIMEYKNEKT